MLAAGALVVTFDYRNFKLVIKNDGSALTHDLYTEHGFLVASGFTLLGEPREELAARMRAAVDAFLESHRNIRRVRRGQSMSRKSFPQTHRDASPFYHRVEDRAG